MIYDFYSDPQMSVVKELISTEGADVIPDCVKQAKTLVPSEEYRREKRAFAWPGRNLFAIDSEADVWFSAQYFKKTAHLIPIQYRQMVEDNIKAAAEAFGVDTTLPSERVEKQASAPADPLEAVYGVKKASEMADFSMALDGAEAVKVAMASFPRGIEHLDAMGKHQIASALCKFAAVEGLTPPAAVVEHAHPVKRSHVVDQMTARWSYCLDSNNRSHAVSNWAEKMASYVQDAQIVGKLQTFDADVVNAYQELAEKAASIALEDMPQLLDLCRQFDEITGLDKIAGFRSAAEMNRTIVDDMAPKFVKLAGFRVPMELVVKEAAAVAELVPYAAEFINHPVKLAYLLSEAGALQQKALLNVVNRNWH